MQEHRADLWDNSNVLAVMAGSASEDLRYLKSVSLHLWLFGYEVTGMAVCSSRCCRSCRCSAASAAALTWGVYPGFLMSGGLFTFALSCAADTLLVFTDKTLHVMTTTKKGMAKGIAATATLSRCQP